MFELDSTDHPVDRESLLAQASALLDGQNDRVANAANLSSFLFYTLENVNWVGFYFVNDGQLLVGPFQGRPACVTIPLGQGVCGNAAESRTVQRVADVHAFEGHIACDTATRSEIVIPLVAGEELIGVLDLDSPIENRFDEEDERYLVSLAQLYISSLA